MRTEEEFLGRLKIAILAEDLVVLHLSLEENMLLGEFDNTLDKRQADLEKGFGRELVPEEENLLVKQTFNDLPGSWEAFNRRDSLIEILEKQLANKRS